MLGELRIVEIGEGHRDEAVAGGAHEPPLGAEMDREDLAERGIVFHEEHGAVRGHARPRRP